MVMSNFKGAMVWRSDTDKGLKWKIRKALDFIFGAEPVLRWDSETACQGGVEDGSCELRGGVFASCY